MRVANSTLSIRILKLDAALEHIQQHLFAHDSQLIEIVRYVYFNPQQQGSVEQRYAAYILNPQGNPIGIDLGPAEEIEHHLNLHRRNLTSPKTPLSQIQESSQTLAQLILKPLEPHLKPGHRLLIAPDSALNLLPFETLTTQNGQYLIESHPITYLTSGRDLTRLNLDQPHSQNPVILGDPFLQKNPETIAIQPQNENAPTRRFSLNVRDYEPLLGTRTEAQEIAQLFNVEPILGASASESTVKQVNQPQILHIASHGFFAPNPQSDDLYENPMLRSGLVLAGLQANTNTSGDDGLLTAYETANLNLYGTQLVVLSACDTGQGGLSAGDGVYGLRRSLVLAGSESQVISLWKVADDATQELMVNYYEKLKAGEGRSEALRQTQLAMLNSEERNHPYYWAAFIPSGNPDPLD